MTDVALTIPLSDFDYEKALDTWRWLLPSDFKPFVMTAFGDCILVAPDGRIHMLDLVEGRIKPLAASATEFNHAIDNDPDKRNEWLMERLVIDQADRGIRLNTGQCFGFKIPPVVGGEFDAKNIVPYEIVAYVRFAGDFHEQFKDLPDGSQIEFRIVD